MGIVCFFQADAKVGLTGERAGETVIESKQRIISRSMFSADFQAVCQILIITFSVQIQIFDMAVKDAEKRILIQQIFGRIIGVQIRLSVLEQGVQGIQFQEGRSGRHRSRRGILLPVLSHRSLHGSQDEQTAPDRAERHLQEFLHRYPSRRYRRLPADDIFCMQQVPHGCR